ncbi:head-tail connector protein [Chitinophaga ginsengisegetis]|uniref:head-tail connector protein n=1 Tax=Chitinophaga ginsengisegetis TaxID=393003 RepID=UPI000DB992C4|nr:head-tail connector protein [Chitinophaga ginsengisegetis]MDR6565458.1 hypothetical protein [Chitinophaga ginsengisegetis]MDR6645186.1 hypothetical protein [Chitinophaga ginsengisegetis]MDR6652222.1 hypothetical protein [Chitinophaga ginsengisegetis]
MALLRTIPEVKQWLRVDFSDRDEIALPNIAKAEKRYIIPVLGKELYQQLADQYNTDSLTEANKTLLDYVQAALTPLAYLLELPLINTRITDNGLRKQGSPESPVFKWDYQEIKQTLEDSGMEATDNLLEFLEAHSDDYPEWKTSTAHEAYTRYFIKTGREFSNYYQLLHPRAIFMYLLPVISTVEDLYINASIGEGFAAYLKGLTAPTALEEKVLRLVKTAICHFAVFQACSRMGVSFTNLGFTVLLSDPETYKGNQQTAEVKRLEMMRSHVEQIGQKYLSDLQALLNKNATPVVFPLYYNSSHYVNPNEIEVPDNETYNSFFSF